MGSHQKQLKVPLFGKHHFLFVTGGTDHISKSLSPLFSNDMIERKIIVSYKFKRVRTYKQPTNFPASQVPLELALWGPPRFGSAAIRKQNSSEKLFIQVKVKVS